MLLSTLTPSDEFNHELAEFFGTTRAEQGSNEVAQESKNPNVVGTHAGHSKEAQLVSEVQAVNAELFSFFGMPRQGHDRGHAAASLALLAGQLEASSPAAAAVQQGNGSCENTSSMPGSKRSSSAPFDTSRPAPELTHVDASGKAAMVDVSQASVLGQACNIASAGLSVPAVGWCGMGEQS
jgi:hypothetical protein